MIELKNDALVFRFPEVHADARLSIEFQRTLRIPDDGASYPLPPGLGRFPVRHVDDFGERVPDSWRQHGGVLLPMYQSEALWVNFSGRYPFAVKIATGKINAVTGDGWSEGLATRPQDYLSIPEQPWLDGYCVSKGIVRQFVAMPLGAGYSAEEQLTGEAVHGGLQVLAYPMKAEAYERRRRREEETVVLEAPMGEIFAAAAPMDMGLAPGGAMKQEIYDDPNDLEEWDTDRSSRCFVHIANSMVWRAVTGENPPTTPPTAEEYTRRGLPWFEYYGGDLGVLDGSSKLDDMDSVVAIGAEKGDVPLPENISVEPGNVIGLGQKLTPDQVREGSF